MPIELSCTGCGRVLRVADDAAGKHARCPACGNVSRVPAPASAGVIPAGSELEPSSQGVSSHDEYTLSPLETTNPFADVGPTKHSPYGGQGVNPFGDAYAGKDTGNPYQAPGAFGYTPPGRFNQQLSSRGKRFAGAMLDGFFHLLGLIPGAVLAGIIGASGGSADEAMLAFMFVGLGGVFLVAIANWVLIARTGQSFAKRLLGMRIILMETGQPVGFLNGVVLRIWVPQLINQACNLFGIIDALWIFNEERRCIHDLIAQTVVVDV